MNKWLVASVLALTASSVFAAELTRPKAGKVEIFHLKDIRPGMMGTAWTVFQGMDPEPVPIEIVGVWKNGSGPRQDVILAKMGGKAKITNVAAGMSGSPVYIDGKLVGAVALRMSMFSPDAVCGITPIELMLEIPEYDQSRPMDAKTPDKPWSRNRAAAASTVRLVFRARCRTDRYAAGSLRIFLAGSRRVLAVLSSDGNHRGARRLRRRTIDGEARRWMARFLEPRRSGFRSAGIGRYVGHRHGHGHL